MKLKDKIVVITGASHGLGESLAYKVAKEGAKVALVSKSGELLKSVQKRIQEKNGEAEIFVCDITFPDQIGETVKKIVNHFKTIDVLVNNAGIWTDEEIESSAPEHRREVFETNVLGHIEFTYAVLPHLKEKNNGYIFNVISTAGASDTPAGNNARWKTYGATKWAMSGFTKALIDDLQQTKIKVTGFHPGGFDSHLYEAAGRPNAHNQPWMMQTEDIADIIIFALTRPADVQIERLVVTKK